MTAPRCCAIISVELQSPKDTPRITQPVCPYVQKAIYAGGDPRVAASFGCG